MNFFWYVCDGEVEEYDGQEVNWNNSVVVFARSAGRYAVHGAPGTRPVRGRRLTMLW